MTVFRLLATSCALVACSTLHARDYTPGVQHNFTHESGAVPEDAYQYSLWVPNDYKPDLPYPVVIYLHGGGKGRFHPDQGKRNMVSARLIDNQRWTDAGYSGNAPGHHQYLHVAPVKKIARWEPGKFKRLLDHVRTKVNLDLNRIYLTGFSMGGQGTWFVGCGADQYGYKIAAMMPLGAWGCNEVPRAASPESCPTAKTPIWVQHCPLDHVSRISQQIPLFQNHLDCGGYGRFTMIPGEGHIKRPAGDDDEGFSMRVAWMLSQTHGTPINYTVQVDTGVIMEVVRGERPFLGDTCKYGFFEPGTVIRLTAPETRNGKSFVKWAGASGTFSDPAARRPLYTVGNHDVHLTPIYDKPAKLTVVGGTAQPANPNPGDLVTVTADAQLDPETDPNGVFYWTTVGPLDLPHPYKPSFQFCMPSQDVTVTAKWHVEE